MHFSSSDITSATAYKLLVSTILPRPIAFVTTISQSGIPNAAPFSFFNAMGSNPPVVALGFEPKQDGGNKDTATNILETKEFVVNMVDEQLSVQMNQCAADLASDIDELQLAKLDTLPSIEVTPLRISASPVSMECQLYNNMELEGGGHIIIGKVLHFHLRDNVVTSLDPLRISLEEIAPISRLSGPHYGRVNDIFKIIRPK
jgi:flavin reductase (DIM6/NTAB) family NADH-FMN oxidoreductase RutF